MLEICCVQETNCPNLSCGLIHRSTIMCNFLALDYIKVSYAVLDDHDYFPNPPRPSSFASQTQLERRAENNGFSVFREYYVYLKDI